MELEQHAPHADHFAPLVFPTRGMGPDASRYVIRRANGEEMMVDASNAADAISSANITDAVCVVRDNPMYRHFVDRSKLSGGADETQAPAS